MVQARETCGRGGSRLSGGQGTERCGSRGADRGTFGSDLKGNQVNALAGLTFRVTPDLLVGVLGGYEHFDYVSQAFNGALKGDGWTTGGKPLLVDDRESFLKRVRNKQYIVRDLDSVDVEMHGDIAITYGRYVAQNRTGNPGQSWFAVWFERVYAKRNGHWLYVSHRTVHGPTYGPDRQAVSDK